MAFSIVAYLILTIFFNDYLYAVENSTTVVARTATHDLYSPWQYYVKDASGNWTWQDNYPTESERRRSSIMTSSSWGIMGLPYQLRCLLEKKSHVSWGRQ